ncbi:anthranilate synthase component I family protein [Paucihalobacter ruber]|uniref:Anthranilate synthase component I family protein n=1 Tax=Paucihalobacter ruber TaxID=2567861 RepID=A0A506PG34_9FLAO|nr:anthranilate synthase component I family protein [Paucihalobacter ruber]TPV32365.1 anthranilate synthase component I family protein [Paucihalobacter ruber]
MRTSVEFKPKNLSKFKKQLLLWALQFDEVVWLDSNNYQEAYSRFDAALAVDAFTGIKTDSYNAFEDLKDYQKATKDWIFGYLTYDLKNDLERLTSNNFDGLEFPDLQFFQPKRIVFFKGDTVVFEYLNMVSEDIEADFNSIEAMNSHSYYDNAQSNDIKIKMRIHKDAYFEKVNTMLAHIHRGDIYEANFCQEFYAEDTIINPLKTFNKLNNISQPPFAAFLKLNEFYLLCASPERYIQKQGSKVVSQPIKGTAKRSKNEEKDKALKFELSQNEKERSENIMIVDLVRNDLSHTAKKGSVEVDELCKVYTFKQVHQMISTVTSLLDNDEDYIETIKTTFPMGSMTGAPKLSAMQIIEALEETKRGLYSGAVGYFTPENDFDFNVVIRSILYNEVKKYVSFSVGSAITSKSNPLDEYEECLVKAKAMREALKNHSN